MILSPEQEKEVERFKQEQVRIRKELRDVRLGPERRHPVAAYLAHGAQHRRRAGAVRGDRGGHRLLAAAEATEFVLRKAEAAQRRGVQAP